ncbi:MAG: MFS transporter [Gammaproteobacteria bacterium]|jgi:MFS family permease
MTAVGIRGNTPLAWYIASTAFFLVPGGIQMVLHPWLVAVYLNESASRLGLLQMAGQLPMVLLILWGGLLGDRVDQRRLLIGLQTAMALPPLVMAALVQADLLVYGALLVWSFVGGCLGAFAQPARDALLNRVAGRDIQRVVTLAIGVQFGVQILGFGIGSLAERSGPAPLMVCQTLLMLVAVLATRRIPPQPGLAPAARGSALRDIAEGLAIVWRSTTIRPAILLTFAVGVFFAGAYMVILPFMVRDLYGGSAGGIALVFGANMLGTCTTIFFLMRRGGLARPGRAMIIGSSISLTVLSLLMLELPAPAFYLVVYIWGLCGGISMTMSRAIVQEASPESHRARVLSVYSLGMMGGMPLGSIVQGACVDAFGVRAAVLLPVVGMAIVIVLIVARTRLWSVRRGAVDGA